MDRVGRWQSGTLKYSPAVHERLCSGMIPGGELFDSKELDHYDSNSKSPVSSALHLYLARYRISSNEERIGKLECRPYFGVVRYGIHRLWLRQSRCHLGWRREG